MSTSVTGCFIDFDDVRANLAEDAVIGKTRYRTRPQDKGCLHPLGRVRYGTPHHGIVQAMCTRCLHEWNECKVVEVELSEKAMQHIADQLAQKVGA